MYSTNSKKKTGINSAYKANFHLLDEISPKILFKCPLHIVTIKKKCLLLEDKEKFSPLLFAYNFFDFIWKVFNFAGLSKWGIGN